MRNSANQDPLRHDVATLWVAVVWGAGLIATLYLLANSLYLAFLVVAFVPSSTPWLESLASVGVGSLPLLASAAVGIAGLVLWLSPRFRVLGLGALLVETAAALYLHANPESLLAVIDVFGK